MAPPTPVYSGKEIRHQYATYLEDPLDHKCLLRSLTQYECTFKVSPNNLTPAKIICLPFKRLFQRCLMPVVETVDGKKVRYNKWTNIEVTDETTNRDLLEQSRYGKDIEEFMEAEKELQRYMENLEREERTNES